MGLLLLHFLKCKNCILGPKIQLGNREKVLVWGWRSLILSVIPVIAREGKGLGENSHCLRSDISLYPSHLPLVVRSLVYGRNSWIIGIITISQCTGITYVREEDLFTLLNPLRRWRDRIANTDLRLRSKLDVDMVPVRQ